MKFDAPLRFRARTKKHDHERRHGHQMLASHSRRWGWQLLVSRAGVERRRQQQRLAEGTSLSIDRCRIIIIQETNLPRSRLYIAPQVEIIDYMYGLAIEATDSTVQAEWLKEAEHLQGDQRQHWGGHMAILAYTAMREKRVILHTKQNDGPILVQEQCHESVAEIDAMPEVHLLYNGVDHYDALAPVSDIAGMAPAWPQAPPPRYMTLTAFPPLAAAVHEPVTRKAAKPGAPRPKAKQNKRSGKAKQTSQRPSAPVAEPAAGSVPTAMPDEPEPEDLLQRLAEGVVAAKSSHPRRSLEDLIKDSHKLKTPKANMNVSLSRSSCLVRQDLATRRLRDHPTIPPNVEPAAKDAGELWPQVFCAFQGCEWAQQVGTEEALHHHLSDAHAEDLAPISLHMLRRDADDAFFSVYSAAIAEKCRAQAPIAGASFDRTALQSLADAVAGEKAVNSKTNRHPL